MIRELNPESALGVWSSLLELRRHLCTTPAPIGVGGAGGDAVGDTVGFTLDPERGWCFTESFDGAWARDGRPSLRFSLGEGFAEESTDGTRFCFERYLRGADPLQGADSFPDPAALTAYRLYLPMLLGGMAARRRGGTFLAAHLAQTLDGRIACANGSSQWIGNEANLHHAHRLRALHDAVVVGRATLAQDDPRLTVRHVEGEDPRRVVISGSGRALEEEASRLFEGAGGLVVLDEANEMNRAANLPDGVELVTVPSEPDPDDADGGHVSPRHVCAALAERGLHGLFLEGGSRTLSSFLEAGSVDVLHVHLAPLLLGSGIPSVKFAEVERLADARRLTVEYFAMDGELLVECRPGGG